MSDSTSTIGWRFWYSPPVILSELYCTSTPRGEPVRESCRKKTLDWFSQSPNLSGRVSTFKYPTPSIQAFRSTWYGGEESVDFLTWLNNPRYRSVIVNYWERHQTSHHHIREKTRGDLSARGEMRMGRRREPNKNSSTNNSISPQIKFTSLSN